VKKRTDASDGDSEELLEAIEEAVEEAEELEEAEEADEVALGKGSEKEVGSFGFTMKSLGIALGLVFPFLFVTALSGDRFTFLEGTVERVVFSVLLWLLVASGVWVVRVGRLRSVTFLPAAFALLGFVLVFTPWVEVRFDVDGFRKVFKRDRLQQLNASSSGGKATREQVQKTKESVNRYLQAILGTELYDSQEQSVVAFRQLGAQVLSGMASYNPAYYVPNPDEPLRAKGLAARMDLMQIRKQGRWFRPEQMVQADPFLVAIVFGLFLLFLFSLGAARSAKPGSLYHGAFAIGALAVTLFLVFVVLGWQVETQIDQDLARLRKMQPRKELYSLFNVSSTTAPFVSCLYAFAAVMLLGIEIFQPKTVSSRRGKKSSPGTKTAVMGVDMLDEPQAKPSPQKRTGAAKRRTGKRPPRRRR
jgi:hypothetical protein